jgi:hypothetical protein
VTLSVKEWEGWREAAGLHIDPETAEVPWEYSQVMDPYGVCPEIPEERDCVGRAYFARSPGLPVWIHFGDLPQATQDALWEKHKSQLAFPAGLDFIPSEQNFDPTSRLSDEEFDEAMAALEAYWVEDAARRHRREMVGKAGNT